MNRALFAVLVVAFISSCGPVDVDTGSGSDASLWAEEAVAYKEAAFRASREGIPNALAFLSEDLVFEETTGCRVIYGRDDFIEFSGIVFGETDPSRLLRLFVDAEDSLDQYYWESPKVVDWLDRVRSGPDGIERMSLGVSIEVARSERPDEMDYHAIEALADRYVAFWNGESDHTAELLYVPDAVIDDTLLGLSTSGTTFIAEAARSGRWPDLSPVKLTRLPYLPATASTPPLVRGKAIYVSPGHCVTPPLTDEIRLVVESDDGTGCPGLVGVVLGWDGDRVLWERRYREVESVRRCLPTETLEPGWWEGIRIPDVVARELTMTFRVTDDMPISLYNGNVRLAWFVEWGVKRFIEAGLEPPRLNSITFLSQKSRCDGFAGFASTGDASGADITLCHTPSEICLDDECQVWTARAKRALFHEYGHAWIHDHVDEAARTAFLEKEGLDWAEHDQPPELRGTERAADAIAFGLMDELSPLWFNKDVSCEHYQELFRMLTGVEPLNTCPS